MSKRVVIWRCLVPMLLGITLACDEPEVTDPPPTPTLRLQFPNGGETLVGETVETILWSAQGAVGKLEVAFSSDSSTWQTIAEDVEPSSGSLAWNVPDVAASTAWVRLRGAQISDQSDSPFRIEASMPTLSWRDTAPALPESVGRVTLWAELNASLPDDLSIPFSVSGTAVAPEDHSLLDGSLLFPAGATEASLEFDVIDDQETEGTEQIEITLESAEVRGTPTTLVVLIDDDDQGLPLVRWESAGQTVEEADAPTVEVTAVLSEASVTDITIPYSVGGTATVGEDHDLTQGQLSIPAGATRGQLTFAVLDDAAVEGEETVILAMGIPTGASLALPVTHVVTIVSDESYPAVAWDGSSQVVAEEAGVAIVAAELETAAAQTVYVPYRVGGTATAPEDHDLRSGTLAIPEGETRAELTIHLVDDILVEPEETIQLTMEPPVNAVRGSPATHTITLVDDDVYPEIEWQSPSQGVTEGTGTATAIAALSFAYPADVAVTVDVSGTAAFPEDHGFAAGELVVPAGQVSAALNARLVNDFSEEPDETIVLTMTAPVGATLGAQTEHTITIEDDDHLPPVSWTTARTSTHEGAGDVTLTAFLPQAATVSVTVPFSVGGTSTGADHTLADGALVIAAGETTGAVSFSIVDDNEAEGAETIEVDMGSPDNAQPGLVTHHVVVIVANDNYPRVTWRRPGQIRRESDGSVTLTAVLSSAVAQDVIVPLTVKGTAVAPDDHDLVASTITIPAGHTVGQRVFNLIDDQEMESTEEIRVTLLETTGAALAYPTQHAIQLLDDDAPAETLDLTSPTGGEVWEATSAQEISWTSTLADTPVDIWVSTNDGETWMPVALDETDDGSFTWTVPNAPGAEARVRVATRDGSAVAESAAPFTIAGAASGQPWYVRSAATGANSGTSWANAFSRLQDAAAVASPGDEIWVAEGTYTRADSADPVVLTMVDGVSVYGGFFGDELTRDARDPALFATVLDGEDVALHVVVGASSAVLDGFTLTRGDAGGGVTEDRQGGCLSVLTRAGLLLRDLTFEGCRADGPGDGVYIGLDSSVGIEGCTFASNHGEQLVVEHSDVAVTDSSFLDARDAVLVSDQAYAHLLRCDFRGNDADHLVEVTSSHLLVENSVFTGNQLRNVLYASNSELVVRNVTSAGNFIDQTFGATLWAQGNVRPRIVNSILWDRTDPARTYFSLSGQSSGQAVFEVAHSDFAQNGPFYDLGGNIQAEPMFADLTGGDVRLTGGSPCIDAADGAQAPPADMGGLQRHDVGALPDPGVGSPSYADMGAHEYQGSELLGLLTGTGSEAWTIGETAGVTWLATGPANVRIELSRDDGASWETIAASVAVASGLYTWTVTGPASPKCRLRLTDTSDAGLSTVSGGQPIAILDPPGSPADWYVDATATGAGSGATWSDAFTSVQAAADAAAPGDTVWVAEGSYVANGSTNVLAMTAGVSFYGGFPSGGSDLGGRNPARHITVLDGENAVQRVVLGADGAELHDLTITGATYNAIDVESASMRVVGCTITGNTGAPAVEVGGSRSAQVFEQTRFVNNQRDGGTSGGCLSAIGDHLIRVEDCWFEQCGTNGAGGAIFAAGAPTLVVSGGRFVDNHAGNGGGAIATGGASGDASDIADRAEISRSWFVSNRLTGGLAGGAIHVDGKMLISNSVFWGNQSVGASSYAGALAVGDHGIVEVVNSTFARNYASAYGGAIYNRGVTTVTNSILWGDSIAYSGDPEFYSLWDHDIIVSASLKGPSGNPWFKDIEEPWVGLQLWPFSPCVDAADGGVAPATDILTLPRTDDPGMDNTGTGSPDYVDMGAFELQP